MFELGQPVYYEDDTFDGTPMFVRRVRPDGRIVLSSSLDRFPDAWVYAADPELIQTGPEAIAKHVAWKMGVRDA